jgi:microcystin degradation protein MlrC
VRVAIAGISHETNTYAVDSTGHTGLDLFRISRGAEILERERGVRTFVGGMLDAADEIGAEVVPTFLARADPSGTIAAEAYASMKAELLATVEAVLPVDAVALELHGAGVVDGTPDLEGDLGSALRDLVGLDVPVVAAFDLHGNVTDEMVEAYDVLLPVHLYPHTDMWERGHEVVSLLPGMLDGTIKPVVHVEHLPVLLPSGTTDPGHPANEMNDLCYALEAEDGVIDVAVFHGFPYTDTADVGLNVVCTTDGDPDKARAAARRVAAWVWANKERFRPETQTPETAVRLARDATEWPVVINDTADNPGGGTPGDATHVLRALLDGGLDGATFGFICDPEVVEAARQAGVGATIHAKLGGKHDELHGEPIDVTGYVKCLTDGRFVLRNIMEGVELDHGPTARLLIDGVDVIVTSKPYQTLDPEVFLLHGIDVTRYKVVALKGSNHFRAGFRDIAARIITADSPGLTTQRVEVFERRHAPGPLWPLDADATYDA